MVAMLATKMAVQKVDCLVEQSGEMWVVMMVDR